MDISKLQLSTRSDLAGKVPSEGEYIYSEIAHVIATADNGERWAHPKAFAVVSTDLCGKFPTTFRNQGEITELERLLTQLQEQQKAGTLSLNDWAKMSVGTSRST